jgi:hypothetical protein
MRYNLSRILITTLVVTLTGTNIAVIEAQQQTTAPLNIAPIPAPTANNNNNNSPSPSNSSLSASGGTGSGSNGTKLVPEDIAKALQIFKLKLVPGTRPDLNCTYLSTPQASDGFNDPWDCPAGNFCMAKGLQERCPQGFMCPPNTAQPFYCCAGYYCPTPKEINICPSNKFCPLGSTTVQGCHLLASCPEGTSTVSKFGVVALFAGLMLVVAVVSNYYYYGYYYFIDSY